jgi:hypothetical protein
VGGILVAAVPALVLATSPTLVSATVCLAAAWLLLAVVQVQFGSEARMVLGPALTAWILPGLLRRQLLLRATPLSAHAPH